MRDTNTAEAETDFSVTGGGTIYLLRPISDQAKLVLDERIGEEASWLGGAVAVEHRFIDHIVEDLQSEGYTFDMGGAN